jgi:hypothetical protein
VYLPLLEKDFIAGGVEKPLVYGKMFVIASNSVNEFLFDTG